MPNEEVAPTREAEAVVTNGALLSAVEIGLGSFLHGLNIPLAGHFLSLNQAFLMSRAMKAAKSKTLPMKMSNVAAVLKSLSPAGKKLTPMLAISAQGLFYTVGPLLFGVNLAGMIAGSMLSSAWAFLQPLLIAYLIFGETLVRALVFLLNSVQKSWGIPVQNQVWLAVSLVAFKLVLAVGVAVAANRIPETMVKRYLDKMLAFGKSKRASVGNAPRDLPIGAQVRGALGDLTSPLFFFSLALTVIFFVWADSPASVVIWAVLRPVAVGFLLFFLFRVIPLQRISKTVQGAVSALREM